jgi:hypothetical protein
MLKKEARDMCRARTISVANDGTAATEDGVEKGLGVDKLGRKYLPDCAFHRQHCSLVGNSRHIKWHFTRHEAGGKVVPLNL